MTLVLYFIVQKPTHESWIALPCYPPAAEPALSSLPRFCQITQSAFGQRSPSIGLFPPGRL